MGLWIVPIGEMEGFYKSVGAHSLGWMQQAIEKRDLSNDSDLEHALKFVREIWESKQGNRP